MFSLITSISLFGYIASKQKLKPIFQSSHAATDDDNNNT